MKKEERNIFLAMPCGSGQVYLETMQSILSLKGIKNYGFIGSSLVFDARNKLLHDFLKTDCDYMYMIDDDMVAHPKTATVLREVIEKTDYDLATAMIFKRKPEYSPCFYVEKGTLPDGKPAVHHPVEWGEGVLPIVACGLASCLITRKLAEKVLEITDNPFVPDGNLGEDIKFCEWVEKAGLKMACYTGIETGHIGNIVVSKAMWDSYYSEHKDEFPIKGAKK